MTQKGKVFASLGCVRLVPCVQVFLMEILELSQGNIRENSGNFFFIKWGGGDLGYGAVPHLLLSLYLCSSYCRPLMA